MNSGPSKPNKSVIKSIVLVKSNFWNVNVNNKYIKSTYHDNTKEIQMRRYHESLMSTIRKETSYRFINKGRKVIGNSRFSAVCDDSLTHTDCVDHDKMESPKSD